MVLGACTWLPGQELPKPRGSALPLIPSPPIPMAEEYLTKAELLETGKKNAEIYCQVCHLLPDPILVDKKTWWTQILPRMGARLGLPALPTNDPEAPLNRASGVFPDTPMLSSNLFYLIADYYYHEAPEISPPQPPRSEIKLGLKQFEVSFPRFRSSPPASTLVKISETNRCVYLGDDAAKALFVLDSAGQRIATVPIGNTAVSLLETGQRTLVTCIGSFIPSERRLGEIFELAPTASGFERGALLLEKLPRTVDLAVADLNADGHPDLVPCIFGNLTGRFSWFAGSASGAFVEDELMDRPGPIHCVVHDFDQDGFPDIAVLVAQAIEGLYILYNDGHGQFNRRQMVFQKPPVYGHTGFDLVDFNRDGQMDFLVSCGDNGEYTSPPKNYHGLRLYEYRGRQTGTNRYEETWSYPLNGVMKTLARDFDGDGDLDIAAISWFPDYEKSPRESFVYLENQGAMKFEASTFRECITGRWLVMDAGDLDGDGDVDLALGSYIYAPISPPEFLLKQWETAGPSVVLLRNKLVPNPKGGSPHK
jgi:hypothetical protein